MGDGRKWKTNTTYFFWLYSGTRVTQKRKTAWKNGKDEF